MLCWQTTFALRRAVQPVLPPRPCSRASTSTPGPRRAFALPIVLLLVLVAGVVIAAMMQRHVAQALTTQREALQYTFHHASRGAQEAIEAWLRQSGATRNMPEALGIDGHAFDMVLENGMTIRVSLYDAQDTVLVEMAGLPAASRDLARAMIDELTTNAGPGAVRFIRREGPLAISVNSAPKEVLFAAINAITDGEGTDNIVSEILHAREGGSINAQSLNDVFVQAEVDPEVKQRLGLVLTAQPSLWKVVAEAQDSQAVYIGKANRRFCGLVILSGSSGINPRDRVAALQPNSLITSWQDCSEQN